ncbi:MAG: DUF4249 family protein [Vicingaceae bacterium]|nr:DUF4249 family protein [Vicingaceae bacterium]
MKKNNLVFIILMSIVLFSCEKDIDIELDNAKQKFVVEGSIEPGIPPFVILTKTEGYFDPVDVNTLKNSFVNDAFIQVSNGTHTAILLELCSDQIPDSLIPTVAELVGISVNDIKNSRLCIYSTLDQNIFGEVGKTYDLRILAQGETITSTTTIPTPVPMERYWYKDQPGYDNYGYLWFQLNDPPTLGNAYRIYTQRLGKDNRFIPANGSVFDDNFFNGLDFEAFIFRGREPNTNSEDDFGDLRNYYEQGDTIAVKFCTIDQPHFQFWQTFEVAAFNSGNPFAAPATIKSNINGGLGVWGGYGVVYDTIVAVD